MHFFNFVSFLFFFVLGTNLACKSTNNHTKIYELAPSGVDSQIVLTCKHDGMDENSFHVVVTQHQKDTKMSYTTEIYSRPNGPEILFAHLTDCKGGLKDQSLYCKQNPQHRRPGETKIFELLSLPMASPPALYTETKVFGGVFKITFSCEFPEKPTKPSSEIRQTN